MLGNGPTSGLGGFPPPPLHFESAWPITYHPGLAAEVVDGIEGVDGGQPSILEADDQAAVVFAQGHAVGVLADQDEVRLEGSAKRGADSSVNTSCTEGTPGHRATQPAGKSTDLVWSLPSGTPQFRMGMGCGTVDEESQMQAQPKG